MILKCNHFEVNNSQCETDKCWASPGAVNTIQFNSIQVYLYSAFYDTIVAKRFTGN